MRIRIVVGLIVVHMSVSVASADPVGTAFTYQGELRESGAPAAGAFDLRFRLFDAAAGGLQQGPTLCVNDVLVADGRFHAELDFGPVFVGQRRWLEIDVRRDSGLDCANATGFSALSPRQELTATPHAARASVASMAESATTAGTANNALLLGGQPAAYYQNAANLTAGVIPNGRIAGSYSSPVTFGSATNIFVGNGSALASLNASSLSSGTIPSGRFSGEYPNAVTLNNAANVFAGSGAGLTSLNASNITTGTLADGLHSGNIPRLNASNFFTASANRFTEVNVDVFETNNGTFTGGVLRLGGPGSGEGIASNRASDVNGNRYGIDFYTNGGTRRMSLTLGGDLGLGTNSPSGRFHVRTSGGSIIDVNTILAAELVSQGSDTLSIAAPIWQSFSPNFSGSVTSIQTILMLSGTAPSFTCNLTAYVYEGEGTGGPLLQTVALSGVNFFNNIPVSAQFSFSPPISVVQNQLYTVSVVPSAIPVGQTSFSWLGSIENPEPRGRSREALIDPQSRNNDLGIAVRSTVGPLNALTVTPGGDIGIGTSAPQTRLDVIGGILCDHVSERSSASLKRDIRPLEGAGAIIEALAPSRYRFIDSSRGGEDIGLIAEDVNLVLPELVAHDADGRALGIKYDRLSVVAIGALQEQSDRLRALERENLILRARLERLEQRLGPAPRGD